MRVWLAGILLSSAACGGCRDAPVDPACAALVEKLDRCDATAKDMPTWYRRDLERHCGKAQKACAALDASTPAGCSAFIGCLYEP